MRKLILMVVGVLLLAAITGCGTVKGIGEDLSVVGGWLTKGSDKVQE